MFRFLLRCYTVSNKNSIPVACKIIRKYCTTEKRIQRLYVFDQWSNCKIFTSCTVENKISKLRSLTWWQQTSFLHVNTNVTNNVFLYKCEDLKTSHRNLLIVIVVQLLFWTGLSIAQYYVYFKHFSNHIPLLDTTKSYGLHIFLLLFTILAGPLIFITGCGLITRSVKYVILNRGGKEVTIITYHPFKKDRRFTVPITMVSTRSSRIDATNHVALKVHGHFMNFILEKRGVFVNPELFDCTVGQIQS